MDKKYFVAACRSCSLSSAVCRLLKANRKEVKISISAFIECGGQIERLLFFIIVINLYSIYLTHSKALLNFASKSMIRIKVL